MGMPRPVSELSKSWLDKHSTTTKDWRRNLFREMSHETCMWEDSPAGLGSGSLDYSIGETLASRASLQKKWDDMGMRLVERVAKDLDYR